MTELLVLARLHKDRRQPGTLSLVEIERPPAGPAGAAEPRGLAGDRGGIRKIALQVECRGKSDSAAAARARNLHRDPRQPYGDTPTGRWSGCTVAERPQARPGDGIGPRWIPLPHDRAADRETRELLDPAQPGTRSSLGIHAGRGNGDLVATQGCLRLRDRDFDRLVALIGGRRFDVSIVEEEGP